MVLILIIRSGVNNAVLYLYTRSSLTEFAALVCRCT